MLLGLGKTLTFGQKKIYPYATGGDYVYLYEDTATGKTYRVHQFLSTGTSTLNVEVGGQMEYLIVGGGGGSGGVLATPDASGGGGAGGLLSGTAIVDSDTSYTITVGNGGSGGTSQNRGGAGGNSSAFGLVAVGGGGGGGKSQRDGGNGGSGGGAYLDSTPGQGTSGQGFDGQSAEYGAGGGAGGAGIGPGGLGLASSISGMEVWYASGGARYNSDTSSPGGGGRGDDTISSNLAEDGAPNTGGGGGARWSNTAAPGKSGGSGIVIVRYVVAERKLWTPSELTSLKAWWDAADETTLFDATSGGSTPSNSAAVARIEDKSGSGFHLTQSTSGNRPTYQTGVLNSRSVLRFNRSSGTELFRSNVPLAKNVEGFSIAAVFYPNYTAEYEVNYVFSVSNGTAGNSRAEMASVRRVNSYDLIGGGRRLDSDSYYVSDSLNVLANQTWFIGMTRYDYSAANSQHFVNAVSTRNATFQTSGNTSNTNANTMAIGNNMVNSVSYMTGDVAEVLCFEAALSQSDRQKLEGYLAHKWGLTNNLPAGHPYKYEPPYKVEPEEIVTENLVFNVDSGDYASYPRKGTTWYDLSGNGNHMTLYNPTYYTYDSESNSLDFSRNTSLNIGGYAEKISPTGAISSQTTFFAGDHSVEIWVRLNDIQPTYYYNNSLTTETQNALFVYRGYHTMFYSTASTLLYNLYYSASANAAVGAPVILDYDLQGKWFHSIVVKSGSTLYMYVNGVLVSTRKLTSNTFQNISPPTLRISTGNAGSGSNSWRWYTESNVSAARMYAKALSPTEVTQNFNALKNRYGTASLSEPSGTVTNNLIVHLDAGNSSSYSGSGSTWTDLSGSGNNATLYNTPTYSSSNGGHLSFDGTNEYAEISASASTNLSSSSITVSAWAKSSTSTWSAYWSLVSKYSQFILGPNGQNEIAFLVHTTSGWQPTTYNNAIWGQSGTGFDNTQWHNYVGVYNSSANLTMLYIDGIAVAEVSIVGAVSSDTGPIDLMHREFDVVGTNHLAGSLSNVQIYNRALSSYEVLKNFNALRGRYGI